MQNYYSVYGGATAQYPMYTTGAGGMITSAAAAAAAFYPYLNFGEGTTGGTTSYTGGQGYGVQYPHHHLYPYSALSSTAGYPQHYGAPMSLATTPAMQSGLYIQFTFSWLFLEFPKILVMVFFFHS